MMKELLLMVEYFDSSEVTDGVGVLVTNNGITTGSLLQLPER